MLSSILTKEMPLKGVVWTRCCVITPSEILPIIRDDQGSSYCHQQTHSAVNPESAVEAEPGV